MRRMVQFRHQSVGIRWALAWSFNEKIQNVNILCLIPRGRDVWWRYCSNHWGFGQTLSWKQSAKIIHLVKPNKKKLTRATTRPRTMARGTGPYIRESRLMAGLSPSSQRLPLGTRTHLRALLSFERFWTMSPLGSYQMTSPPRPTTRLHTMVSGSRGDTAVTRSP